jgi:putative FmdB family regulatory protein
MPIYAYRCDACGYAKDVLQKMSEDPLTICPECNQSAFKKQVTAAGFQLKGSGWYVTDFRGGASKESSSGSAASGIASEASKENAVSNPDHASTGANASSSAEASSGASASASASSGDHKAA